MTSIKSATLHDSEQRQRRIARSSPVVVRKITANDIDEYVRTTLRAKQRHQQELLKALETRCAT